MKNMLIVVMLLSGCASRQPRPCQVERISFKYRDDMLDSLSRHPDMTMDLLHTIAILEQEAGGYR